MTLGALVVGVAALVFAVEMNASLVRRGVMDPARSAERGGFASQGRSSAGPGRPSARRRADGAPSRPTPIPADPSRSASGRDVPRARRPVPFVGYEGDAIVARLRADQRPLVRGARRGRRTDQLLHPDRAARRRHDDGPRDGRSVSADARRRDLRPGPREPGRPRPARRVVGPRGARSGRPADALGGPAAPGRRPDGLPVRAERHAIGGASRSGSSRTPAPTKASCSSRRVISALGVVLIVMSLGGVFNTVLLETRQRPARRPSSRRSG